MTPDLITGVSFCDSDFCLLHIQLWYEKIPPTTLQCLDEICPCAWVDQYQDSYDPLFYRDSGTICCVYFYQKNSYEKKRDRKLLEIEG